MLAAGCSAGCDPRDTELGLAGLIDMSDVDCRIAPRLREKSNAVRRR
jgi:hypothetical protein